MRICYVVGKSEGAGFVALQASWLAHQGHDVTLVCTGEGALSEHARLLGLNVVVIPFAGSHLRDIPKILRAIGKMVMLFRGLRPDVVHYHLIKAIIVGRIAALVAGVPTRVSELGGPLSLEVWWGRWLDIMTAWIDTCIVASSECIAAIYRSYPFLRKKVHVIYYGTDTDYYCRYNGTSDSETLIEAGESEPVIGMVAMMYPSKFKRFREAGMKGHEVFLRAAAQLVQASQNARFVVVGDELGRTTGYRDRLEKMTENLGIAKAVKFVGLASDVRPWIHAMKVVVVPSLTENCGGAVEPALMGKLIVASAVGGLPEVIEPGVTGFLVPPNDAAALATAISQALALPKDRALEMGRLARERVLEMFSIDHTGRATERLYASLTGQGLP